MTSRTTTSSPADVFEQIRSKMAALRADIEAPGVVSEITDRDVIMGRGNGITQLPGNVRFRQIVHPLRKLYAACKESEKRACAIQVYEQVTKDGGRFLEVKRWVRIGRGSDRQGEFHKVTLNRALEKCSQALRERKWTNPMLSSGASNNSATKPTLALPPKTVVGQDLSTTTTTAVTDDPPLKTSPSAGVVQAEEQRLEVTPEPENHEKCDHADESNMKGNGDEGGLSSSDASFAANGTCPNEQVKPPRRAKTGASGRAKKSLPIANRSNNGQQKAEPIETETTPEDRGFEITASEALQMPKGKEDSPSVAKSLTQSLKKGNVAVELGEASVKHPFPTEDSDEVESGSDAAFSPSEGESSADEQENSTTGNDGNDYADAPTDVVPNIPTSSVLPVAKLSMANRKAVVDGRAEAKADTPKSKHAPPKKKRGGKKKGWKELLVDEKEADFEKESFPTVLRDVDVLFGRGSNVNKHPGNIRFRQICGPYREEYMSLPPDHKRPLAEKILKMCEGRFLEADPSDRQRYRHVSLSRCIEKVCQALREKSWDKNTISGTSSSAQAQQPKSSKKRTADPQSKKRAEKKAKVGKSSKQSQKTSSGPKADSRKVKKGTYIAVYWPMDQAFYEAIVEDFNGVASSPIRLFFIRYLIDNECEWINLDEHDFKIVPKPTAVEPGKSVKQPNHEASNVEGSQGQSGPEISSEQAASKQVRMVKQGQAKRQGGRRTLLWGSNSSDETQGCAASNSDKEDPCAVATGEDNDEASLPEPGASLLF